MLDFPSNPTNGQHFLAQNGTTYKWVIPPNAWVIVAGPGGGLTTGTGAAVYQTSPTLTGNPLAPTQLPGNNTTRIATTEFVTAAVAAARTT